MAWQSEAKWVWVSDFNDNIDPGQFVLFRKVFKIAEKANIPCVLRISADTRYRCFVNGNSVSFGPCKSYPGKWFFEEVDISSQLIQGDNVISVRVLRFSNSHIGNLSMTRAAIPGLFVHCKIGDDNISTNSTWKAKKDTSISLATRSEWNYALGPPFLSLSEKVDGSLRIDDWTSKEFKDDDWSSAVVSSMKSMMLPTLEPWCLNVRPIPMLPEIQSRFRSALKSSTDSVEDWTQLLLSDKSIKLPANSTTVVDLQSDVLTTGFLELSCNAGKGATIRIICAESYERDMSTGQPRCKTDRADHKNGTLYGPEDFYTTQSGLNHYEPFWFRTFRYIRLTITTTSEPLIFNSFTYRSTHYPLEHSTDVTIPTSSSPISRSTNLSEIYNISLNTLKNCMHETYEDCPYYEQNQFAMDSRLMLLFTYNLSRDDRLPLKTISEFAASQRPDGLLETHFPVSVRCTQIPIFSLFWVLMVEDYHRYFKNPRFVRQYLGTIDRVLQYFENIVDERRLVGRFPGGNEVWPFVDWVGQWMGPGGLQNMCIPNAYKVHGAATYNSLIYAIGLQAAARLCSDVGRKDTANEYLSRATSINAAVNEHCFDGTMYLDGPNCKSSPGVEDRSQHSQIFAILSGAITGKSAKTLLKTTFSTPKLPKASFAILFYAFRAASKTGLYDSMFSQLIEPWEQMLKENLTTCKESAVMHRSDCHGWSAGPIYEVVGEILGVTPPEVGGERVKIMPRVDLQSVASGSVTLQEGRITVGWDKEKVVTVMADRDMAVDVVLGGEVKIVFLKKHMAMIFGGSQAGISSCIVA